MWERFYQISRKINPTMVYLAREAIMTGVVIDMLTGVVIDMLTGEVIDIVTGVVTAIRALGEEVVLGMPMIETDVEMAMAVTGGLKGEWMAIMGASSRVEAGMMAVRSPGVEDTAGEEGGKMMTHKQSSHSSTCYVIEIININP